MDAVELLTCLPPVLVFGWLLSSRGRRSSPQVLACLPPVLSKHFLSVAPIVARVPPSRAAHAPTPSPSEVAAVFEVRGRDVGVGEEEQGGVGKEEPGGCPTPAALYQLRDVVVEREVVVEEARARPQWPSTLVMGARQAQRPPPC